MNRWFEQEGNPVIDPYGRLNAPSPKAHANQAFQGRGQSASSLAPKTHNPKALITQYGQGFFTGVSAYPRDDGSYEMKAGFSKTLNSSAARLELTQGEVRELLSELKKPAHKRALENGQTVTKYPNLVIALKQAEKDIDMYQRPEMLTYLKSRDTKPAQRKAAPKPTHLCRVK